MSSKKKAMVKVGVVLFLMAFTVTVEARFDPKTLLAQVTMTMTEENCGAKYFVKSTTAACCESCVCTKSSPPQCQCDDIGPTCHAACKKRICTFSIPLHCVCADTTNFCYHPCSS